MPVFVPTIEEFDLLTRRVEVLETAPVPEPVPEPEPEPEPPPPPDPPAPPNSSFRLFGPGYRDQGMNATAAGGGSGVWFPWTAPKSGLIESLALYWIYAAAENQYQPGWHQQPYSKGDGGVLTVSLRETVDGPILTSYTLDRPMAPNTGFFWKRWQEGKISYLVHHPFDAPFPVTAGKSYVVQTTNAHSDTPNNWTGQDLHREPDGPGPYPQYQPRNNGVPLYSLKYADGDKSSRSPYADGGVDMPLGTVTQTLVTPGGKVAAIKAWAATESVIRCTLDGNDLGERRGSGWLTWEVGQDVAAGTRTLTFTGTGKMRGMWKYWRDHIDWGGGVSYNGESGWPIWGTHRAADLCFQLAMAEPGTGGPGPPPPEEPETDYRVTNGEGIDLRGATDVRVGWNAGEVVPFVDLANSKNVQLVGTSQLRVEGDLGGPFQSGTVSLVDSEDAGVRKLYIPNSPRSAVSFERAVRPTVEELEIVNPWHLGVHGGYSQDALVHLVNVTGSTQRILAGEGQGVGWEDGGMKITNAHGLRVAFCTVADGYGPGIWLDIHCEDAIVEDNVVRNQGAEGVFVEISRDVVVRRNLIKAAPHSKTASRMGWLYGGGVLVSTSDEVQVLDNYVEDCYHGITVIDQSKRGDTMAGYDAGRYFIDGNRVRHANKVGAAQDSGSENVFNKDAWGDNLFEDINSYEWNSSRPSPF